MRKAYSTDLSDGEWHIIEPLLPGPKRLGRKIEYDRREILNAIFYLNRNGCTWRDLPGDFPPYGIVSHSYHAWRRYGQAINETLRTQVRLAEGRHDQPSAASLDSHALPHKNCPLFGFCHSFLPAFLFPCREVTSPFMVSGQMSYQAVYSVAKG